MIQLSATVYSKSEHASKPGWIHLTLLITNDNAASFYIPAADGAAFTVGSTVKLTVAEQQPQ